MINRLCVAVLALGLALGSGGFTSAAAENFSAPLTTLDFNIVGLKLKASPEYQAVPKGIATQVTTAFDAGIFDAAAIAEKLPKDYTVRAELTGPGFPTPQPLVASPGKPFDIPTLALLGRSRVASNGNGPNCCRPSNEIVDLLALRRYCSTWTLSEGQ